jgi:conjugal transfer pilus assembly protein TrbC
MNSFSALLVSFFICTTVFPSDDQWLEEIKKNKIDDDFSWLNAQVDDFTKSEFLSFLEKKCTGCKSTSEDTVDHDLLIFVSFSMPEEVFLSLSKEIEKLGSGALVIRGLPKNSFKELAKKVFHLRERGVKSPISIDPNKFEEYHIDSVPTFVRIKGKDFDKITGNITLNYALEQFDKKGDTCAY